MGHVGGDGRTGLVKGKVALIAGVGPGLGADSARALAREGASLALLSRSGATSEPLAAELGASGVRCMTVQADITDPAQCRRAAAEVIAEFGAIDILVTVAFRDDSPNRKSLLESDEDLGEWRGIFEINLFGTMLITKAVLGRMVERRSGTIVFVNSMTAERVLAKAGPYAGSKAALQRAAQCVALEVAPLGIRVNSIHPGYMWNDFVRKNCEVRAERNGTTLEQEKALITPAIPLGYIPTTDEYANTVVYLASDMSRPMTGGSVHVNGGMFIR